MKNENAASDLTGHWNVVELSLFHSVIAEHVAHARQYCTAMREFGTENQVDFTVYTRIFKIVQNYLKRKQCAFFTDVRECISRGMSYCTKL